MELKRRALRPIASRTLYGDIRRVPPNPRKWLLRILHTTPQSRVVFTGDLAGSNPRLWWNDGQTFPDPVREVLQTIQESVRSVNTTGLLRFADILVQPPAP